MDITKNNKRLLSRLNHLASNRSRDKVWISTTVKRSNVYYPLLKNEIKITDKFSNTIILVLSNKLILLFPKSLSEKASTLPLILGGKPPANIHSSYVVRGLQSLRKLNATVTALLVDPTFKELHDYEVLSQIFSASACFSNYKINEDGKFYFDFYSIIK